MLFIYEYIDKIKYVCTVFSYTLNDENSILFLHFCFELFYIPICIIINLYFYVRYIFSILKIS